MSGDFIKPVLNRQEQDVLLPEVYCRNPQLGKQRNHSAVRVPILDAYLIRHGPDTSEKRKALQRPMLPSQRLEPDLGQAFGLQVEAAERAETQQEQHKGNQDCTAPKHCAAFVTFRNSDDFADSGLWPVGSLEGRRGTLTFSCNRYSVRRSVRRLTKSRSLSSGLKVSPKISKPLPAGFPEFLRECKAPAGRCKGESTLQSSTALRGFSSGSERRLSSIDRPAKYVTTSYIACIA